MSGHERAQMRLTTNTQASLCGHYEVAQLLLESGWCSSLSPLRFANAIKADALGYFSSGALAERNTFQGERCLYNALNDRIRSLLLRYDYSKSADPLQPWSSHITSLLSRRQPPTSDITLTASDGPGLRVEEFALHKFFLAARTPYFHRKLTEAPDMATWKLSSHVAAAAFRIVLHYLYLDDLTPHTATLPDEEELFRNIDKITKQLEVEQLWEAMLAGSDRRLARQRYQDEVERAQRQVDTFFKQHVLGNRVVVDSAKVNEVRWPRDNFIFADCLLSAEDASDDNDKDDMSETGEEGEAEEAAPTYKIPIGPAPVGKASISTSTVPDTQSIQNGATINASSQRARQPHKPRQVVLYPAHKAMLVRADYFATMFSSAFLEAQASEHLRIIKLDCSPEVLEIILSFLYTEQADIPLELALDVLYMADMLFLEKLKTKAAVIISTLGSGNRNALGDPTRAGADAAKQDTYDASEINIYEILRAAWDLKVQRLEEFAARFLATRLEHYIDDAMFADFVLESANRVENRQETDTIELIDDIRYFLSERFRLRFEDIALSDIEEDAAEGAEIAAGANGRATGTEPAPDGEAKLEMTASKDDAVAADKVSNTQTIVDGGLRTLDGELAEDEFDSDALNYQILLGKIDSLLERLGLDA